MTVKIQVRHNTTIIMGNNSLVDIHTHILFGMDDGARDLDESIAMAKEWVDQGVKTVVATPHFDIKKGNQEEFLALREKNMKLLKDELLSQQIDLQVLNGSELYFRSSMVYEDLGPLAIENTNYLLIELPIRSTVPRIADTFEELILQGYSPILAHIERYPILRNDLDLLHRLSNMGVILQVNADTLLEEHSSWLKGVIRKNYVDLIASDAHNLTTRPVNLKEALDQVKDQDIYNENAIKILNNEELLIKTKAKILKIFNQYF